MINLPIGFLGDIVMNCLVGLDRDEVDYEGAIPHIMYNSTLDCKVDYEDLFSIRRAIIFNFKMSKNDKLIKIATLLEEIHKDCEVD